MTSSTAHAFRIVELTAVELERMSSNRGAESDPARMRCQLCATPFTHLVSYRYVTGRRGRIGLAVREYCEVHALRFAKKNGVTIEAPP